MTVIQYTDVTSTLHKRQKKEKVYLFPSLIFVPQPSKKKLKFPLVQIQNEVDICKQNTLTERKEEMGEDETHVREKKREMNEDKSIKLLFNSWKNSTLVRQSVVKSKIVCFNLLIVVLINEKLFCSVLWHLASDSQPG